MPREYPAWVCFDCGNKYGRGYPNGRECTIHQGTCGVCGQQKPVTEPRDFGHLKSNWKALFDHDARAPEERPDGLLPES